MCGRYTLRRPDRIKTPAEVLREIDERREQARYNIAPSQSMPVLGRDVEGREVLAAAIWGFHPHWLPADRKSPINARAESAATKPMFRGAFNKGRCLVPADGWYEWQAQGTGGKVPYFFRRTDDEPFWFAGIAARNADGERTFAILTGDAVGIARDVHSRMPLALSDDAAAVWLNPEAGAGDLNDLLRPSDAGLECYAVSRHVNRPSNDDPACIEPAA